MQYDTGISMLSREELKALFPKLPDDMEITSDADDSYNCIAWSLNDTRRPWWPFDVASPFIFWPPNVPREETIAAFVTMYESLLFKQCDNADREDGFDKVALYAAADLPTHAAR